MGKTHDYRYWVCTNCGAKKDLKNGVINNNLESTVFHFVKFIQLSQRDQKCFGQTYPKTAIVLGAKSLYRSPAESYLY